MSVSLLFLWHVLLLSALNFFNKVYSHFATVVQTRSRTGQEMICVVFFFVKSVYTGVMEKSPMKREIMFLESSSYLRTIMFPSNLYGAV